jgi:crotonobetainyl-CoA:carnitine CoA-transferase CaiB-like acyl-CoA transferase
MDNAPKRPAPKAGGHTNAILTQLGYSSDQIAQLLAEDVVRTEA